MGRLAAQNSAKRLRRRSFDAAQVPYGTFTTPEVAQVGLTEEQAPAGSRIALSTFADSDRGMAANERTGFVKLIAGPRRVLGWTGGGKLIGATIVHERAGEMIHEPALIIANNIFVINHGNDATKIGPKRGYSCTGVNCDAEIDE